MSITALDSALTGLRLAQAQISLISNNVANASTPGYTRKILPQESQIVNGAGVGVLGQTVIRNVDVNLQRDLWTQISSSSSYDVRQTYLDRIQQFHGAPDKELSISAEIARLHDNFASLTDNPSDSLLQSNAVNQAVVAARKINSLSKLITQMRNDAQGEMQQDVQKINDLLKQISTLNAQVSNGLGVGRTVAMVQDKRDEAIKSLSELMEISYFQRGDGVIVIQTNDGVELASTRVRELTFKADPIGPTSGYPGSVNAVYVGDPLTDPTSVDITAQGIGGRLGGLIELRDQTFPKQMAQLDELCEQMAVRFDQQGLRLFTDASGNIPSDAPPNSTTGAPVAYVGFSRVIQVNDDIIADNTLLQKGTYGASIASGSNEVLRRVLQFGFGDVQYQQAIGDIKLQVSGNAPPNNTLQNYLGVHSENTLTGIRSLSSFTSPAALIAAANGALDPGSDTFRMTFGSVNVDVALGAVPDTGGDFVQDLISYINTTVIPGLTAPQQASLTSQGVSFSESGSGQFTIKSNAAVTINATAVPNGMGADGLALLGFAEQTQQATDPYFDIRVGNSEPVRITIAPTDDEDDLLAKLQAVPGLAVEDFTASADGFLRLRPGNDYTNPDFGGDIVITSGPFKAASAGANTVIGAGTILNGVSIVSALFGSFNTSPVGDYSPVTDVKYGVQTDAAVTPPIPTVSFRTDLLGPGASISTNIVGAQTLLDFSQRIVNEQTQEAIQVQTRKDDEASLKDTLQKQLLDQSGVNVDEELANLISVQNAYAASARVVSAVNDLFDQLMAAVQI